MPSPPIEALRRLIDLLALTPEEFLRLCKRESFQGSGPGGQKRNRVYSGVRLILDDLSVTASEFRESERNKTAAMRKLRLKLALRTSDVFDPGDLSLSELDEVRAMPFAVPNFQPAFRARVNPEHQDFPRCVLTALVLLRASHGDIPTVASALSSSNSALIKFLKTNKTVFSHVNHRRELYGLHPLR